VAVPKKGVQLNGPSELEHQGCDGSGHVVYPIHFTSLQVGCVAVFTHWAFSACISCDGSFARLSIVSRLVLSACATQRWYIPQLSLCCVLCGAAIRWQLRCRFAAITDLAPGASVTCTFTQLTLCMAKRCHMWLQHRFWDRCMAGFGYYLSQPPHMGVCSHRGDMQLTGMCVRLGRCCGLMLF
jgi:hypothetical protein